LIEYSL